MRFLTQSQKGQTCALPSFVCITSNWIIGTFKSKQYLMPYIDRLKVCHPKHHKSNSFLKPFSSCFIYKWKTWTPGSFAKCSQAPRRPRNDAPRVTPEEAPSSSKGLYKQILLSLKLFRCCAEPKLRCMPSRDAKLIKVAKYWRNIYRTPPGGQLFDLPAYATTVARTPFEVFAVKLASSSFAVATSFSEGHQGHRKK